MSVEAASRCAWVEADGPAMSEGVETGGWEGRIFPTVHCLLTCQGSRLSVSSLPLSPFLSLSLLSAPLSVSVSYLGPLCLLRTCLLHPSLSVNFPLCISPVFRPIRHPRSSKAIPGVLIPSSVCKHECSGSYVPGGGSCEYHGLSRSCHH